MKSSPGRTASDALPWAIRVECMMWIKSWRNIHESVAALKPHVVDTVQVLQRGLRAGKKILFEAAQGSLLDVDHGTYPFVTSSNSSTAGVWSGSGVPARYLTGSSASSRRTPRGSAAGPFPTELDDGPQGIGERIRRTGKEYGTVTGRPRRCGWFDAVAARYSAALERRR